jgi:ubiquinol-cytochrome c reductase cytochrome c subunit
MKQRITLMLVAGLLACMSMAHAADPVGSVENGKKLYMKNMCFTCHGTVGQGGEKGAGPKLAPDTFPLVAFENQLRDPRSQMPRFPKEFVSDQDVVDLHAYVSSVKAGPAAKDIPLLKNF